MQQAPKLLQLYENLQQHLKELRRSFRVTCHAKKRTLDDVQERTFAATLFKFQSVSSLDFTVKFEGQSFAVFQATRRGERPIKSPISQQCGEALITFVRALEVHTFLDSQIKKCKKPLEGCGIPLFDTVVFDDYLDQLHTFCASLPASEEKSRGMAILERLSSCERTERPVFHALFHQELRRSDTLSKAVSSWLYWQCDLSESWWRYLDKLTDSQVAEPTDFLVALEAFKNLLSQHPSLNGVKPCLSLDMLSAGNVPSFLWNMQHQDGSVTRIIRTCSVLYENGQNDPNPPGILLPTFQHLLTDLGDKRLTYAYFEMRATPPEALARLKLTMGLLTYPSIALYRMDRDSDNYDQMNRGPESMESYKKEQLEHFQNQEANLFWKYAEEKATWVHQFEKLQDLIHSHYFENSPILSAEERHDLNELVLVYLAFIKLCTDKPAIASFTCFMTADRGPSFYTLLYLLNLQMAGLPLTTPFIQEALAMALAPALLAENRLMHLERLIPLMRIAKRLLAHPPLRC